MITFRAHLDSSGLIFLKILNLITSANSPLPYEVMYSQVGGLGWGHMGRGIIQPTTVYDLALQVPACHFCCMLLVKQVTKTSLDSREGKLGGDILCR